MSDSTEPTMKTLDALGATDELDVAREALNAAAAGSEQRDTVGAPEPP